jgi:hypothetical protein
LSGRLSTSSPQAPSTSSRMVSDMFLLLALVVRYSS